jgi:hypothetical protein
LNHPISRNAQNYFYRIGIKKYYHRYFLYRFRYYYSLGTNLRGVAWGHERRRVRIVSPVGGEEKEEERGGERMGGRRSGCRERGEREMRAAGRVREREGRRMEGGE